MVNLETEWRASSLPDTHQSLTVTLPLALIFSSHSLLTDQLFVDETKKQRNKQTPDCLLANSCIRSCFPGLVKGEYIFLEKDGVAPYPLAFPLPCSLVGCPHKSNSNTAHIQQSIPPKRPVFLWGGFFGGNAATSNFWRRAETINLNLFRLTF